MAARSTRRSFIRTGAVTGAALASSSLWLPGASAGRPRGGVWLPGDLHTHSTYSHDVYGGPTDDNTGPDESYTLGLPVAGKFLEGRERGLRVMAGSHHDDVRSIAGLGSASQGLIAIPAYETSIKGHAQMLGAQKKHARATRLPTRSMRWPRRCVRRAVSSRPTTPPTGWRVMPTSTRAAPAAARTVVR